MHSIAEPLRRLAGRADFRRNPAKALAKRAAWHLRWLVTSKPAGLRLDSGLSISAPKGAVGALIYYLGSSEPETTGFLTSYLKPGMVFFDVGANIGEYTLVASRRVGSRGSVHAFEAQPDTFALLERNCAANGLENVTLNSCAVSNVEGELEFDVCAEPAMSAIAATAALPKKRLRRIRVTAVSLDGYCRREGVLPDLIKIDVEGAEGFVLRGAKELLSQPAAPAVIFECLPETYSRFGHSCAEVTSYLQSLGYEMRPERLGYNVVAVRQR